MGQVRCRCDRRLGVARTSAKLLTVQMFGSEAITDETVRAATQGSESDRGRIVEALSPRVRAMIMVRLLPSPAQFHAVDDLAQQVLMALSEGLLRLRSPTLGALNAFASVITARKVVDYLRQAGPAKGGRVASLDASAQGASASGPLWELLEASGFSPRSSADRAEAIQQMVTELGLLKPSHREVIALAFFDQLPMAEVAERLALSRPAASMLLIRAVKNLRRLMTGSSRVENNNGDRS